MSLLANLFVPPGEAGAASPELQRNFFDCLRLKNGVYKTTYPHRLDDLNTRVADYLPASRPLRLLDVGISSGVSTLEWMDSLEAARIDYHMTGIDLTIDGLLVSFGDRLHAVLDGTKWPLLFEIDGQWLSNPPRKRHLVRHFFSLALVKYALFLWARRYRESEFEQVQRILGMPTTTRAIHLVTPGLMNHPRVTIAEGNILTQSGLQGEFHAIRAANILNRGYFDDDTLTKILQNLRRHLTPNGILAVCQTHDEESVNRAAIFELGEDNRFAVLAKMSGGSEIEDLILQLPTASAHSPVIHNSELAYSAE
ncbi:MAG: class I SAM-dependent methyltransferase [Candidatus Sulfotelmatobacter sp.]